MTRTIAFFAGLTVGTLAVAWFAGGIAPLAQAVIG